MEEISNLINNLEQGCSKVQKKYFKKNETITTYIQNRNQICIMIQGKADLIRYDLNGNKDIVDNFNSNDIFGEAFYPVHTNNELSVIANTNCFVLFLVHDDILKKCKQNCKFHNVLSSSILELTLNNAIHQNTRIEVLSKRSIREKLLSYFSILSSKDFSKTVTIPISFTNLADYLSVDRSAMMRELKNLIDEGFISKNGNKIKLLYK
ncbi:MAG: Crp/Fnr family transcriptional regulator [Clostridia bacterium]|nr:Crp/Fnr family transcriptional regulator [Clostridia bacterium]